MEEPGYEDAAPPAGSITHNITSPRMPDALTATCVAALVVKSTHVAVGSG